MNVYNLEKFKRNLKWKYFFIYEKVWKCDFDRGKEPIQTHLSWKIGPLDIFLLFQWIQLMHIYTLDQL